MIVGSIVEGSTMLVSKLACITEGRALLTMTTLALARGSVSTELLNTASSCL